MNRHDRAKRYAALCSQVWRCVDLREAAMRSGGADAERALAEARAELQRMRAALPRVER